MRLPTCSNIASTWQERLIAWPSWGLRRLGDLSKFSQAVHLPPEVRQSGNSELSRLMLREKIRTKISP